MALQEKYHRQFDVFCIKNTLQRKLGKENIFKIGGNVIIKEGHFYG